MDLVVARDAFAVGVEQQRGIRDAMRAVALDGCAAGEDPELEFAGGLAKKDCSGPGAVGFRHLLFVGIRSPMNEKFSGKQAISAPASFASRNSLPAAARFLDQVARGHLNRGYFSHRVMLIGDLRVSASAVAAAAPRC